MDPEVGALCCSWCARKRTGFIQIYSLSRGQMELQREVEKKAIIKCCTFGQARLEDRLMATGDFDGRVSLWDPERLDAPLFTAKGHDGLINTIDGVGGRIGYGAPEIVTGGADGCVRVWDPRQEGRPVASLEPPEGTEKKPDCWAVAFGNSFNDRDRCVAGGYDNGDIKLLDLRTSTLRWEANLSNGICSIEFDRKDIDMNKLVATTLESKFFAFDMRTFHPEKGYASLTERRNKVPFGV
eukprot:GAFH01003644.1.p1 GENE.GAFH01003644.1~~GAFH01003644.1.p1  ORF type:complete len:240 (-),score=15.02 GAFH01003644.1:162-881(-)